MFRLGKSTPFRVTLVCLNFYNCYPKTLEESKSIRFKCMCFLMRTSTLVCCCLATFLHLIMMKRDKQKVDTSEDIFVMFGGLGSIAICILFARSSQKWQDYLQRLLDFDPFSLNFEIEEEINRRNYMGYFYALYYVIGNVIYGITSYMNSSTCHSISEEENVHLICDTLFPVWLPFDIRYRPIRWIIFLMQFFSSLCAVHPAAMVCFLIWEATEILCIHIHMLKEHFKIIVDVESIRTRPDGIAFWIQYHNHVLKLAENLRDLAKETVGYVALFSAVVLGTTEHSIVVKTNPIGGIMFLLGWLAALMIVCHTGERLMEQTFSVGAAISESRWYMADEETKKDIVFILLRSQKPIYLEASPLGIINYMLYVMILRTSYSYMTLLNQTS